MSGVISRLLQPTALPLTTSSSTGTASLISRRFSNPTVLCPGTFRLDDGLSCVSGARNNGSLTRPAPLPGVGFECDKFDTAAFNAHFDSFVRQLLPEDVTPYGQKKGGITSLHMDSWEMTAQNWSANFRSEFRRQTRL